VTDLVTFGETALRLSSPRGDRLETTREMAVGTSGVESNVAVAAARLGLDAAWLSKLPANPLGRRVVTELRGHGVRTGVVWAGEGRVGAEFVEHGVDPRETSVVPDRVESAAATVGVEELSRGVVREAETCFTSGVTLGLSDAAAETAAALFEVAADAGTTTALDLRYRNERWSPAVARERYETFLPGVDVLFADRTDVADVLDVDGEPVEAANHLASAYDLRTVVLTLGDRGAVGLHGDEVHERPAVAGETRDAAGSQDAFVGGFLAESFRGGGGLAAALDVGAAAAALTRTLDGGTPVVSREDVERLASDGPER
jgi:2-dehydro-3-deoxygluconokinase